MLWVCSHIPGTASAVAWPMGKPYLMTFSPVLMSAMAILWPWGMSSTAVTVPLSTGTAVPLAMGCSATTTLSAGLILIASGIAVFLSYSTLA